MDKNVKRRYTAFIAALLLVFSTWFPTSFSAEAEAVTYAVQEDFDWISYENMLQADWSCSALHPDEFLDGQESFSKLTLLSKGYGAVTLKKQFSVDFSEDIYSFDFSYSQCNGGTFEWGFLEGDRQGKLVSVNHQSDGRILVSEQSLAQVQGTQITVRVIFNPMAATAELEAYDMKETLLGCVTVDLQDSNRIGGFYITFPDDCKAESGAELFYLYGWEGYGATRGASEDENPLTAKAMMILHEDKFGYTDVSELKDAGYTFEGNEGDAELRIMDGYPAIVRKNGDGAAAILKLGVPSAENLKGETLSGKVRVNFTYEVPIDKKFYIYNSAGPIQILESSLTPPMKTMLVAIKGSNDQVFTSNNVFAGKRVIEVDYDYDRQTYSANINGIQKGTGFRYTSYNKYAGMDIELRGQGNGEEGSYIKISEYKISKELPAYSLIKNTAEYMNLSEITTDWDNLTEDIYLPDEYENLDLSWRSMDESVISDSGTVHRALYDDKSTALIVTYTYNGAKINRAIPVTVKAQKNNRIYFTKDDISSWNISGEAESTQNGFGFSNGSAELTIANKEFFSFGNQAKVENTVILPVESEVIFSCYSDTECIGTVKSSELSIADGEPHKLRFELDADVHKLSLLSDDEEIWSINTQANLLHKVKIESTQHCVVENTVAWIDIEDAPQSMLECLTWAILSDEPSDSVREAFKIPKSPIDEIELSMTSHNEAIDNVGIVSRGGEDCSGKVVIKATVTKNPEIFAEKSFDVVVLKKNMNNYLINSDITSTIRPKSGSSLTNIIDDNPRTVFETSGNETQVVINVDLKEEKVIGTVELLENSETVTNVKVEASSDNSSWTTVYDGDISEIIPSLSKAKYLRLTLTKEKGSLSLGELTITGDYTGAQVISSDWSLLTLPTDNTLESFKLPQKGKWGSDIMVSSASDAISVTKGSDSYTISPVKQNVSVSATLRITLTKDGVEKTHNVSYTIPGKGNSGSGGGGTSVNRPGSGNGGVYLTQPNPTPMEVTESKPGINTTVFSDVNNDYWAREYIEELYKAGIVSGIGNGMFAPENSVTREEFIKMLMLALKFEESQTILEFTDVKESDWFYPYIAAAAANGIVKGISDDEAGIGVPVSREDMASMVYRALHCKDISLEGSEYEFSDALQISDYAKDAVDALYASGVVQGKGDGRFAPKDTATRAETAKIICLVLRLGGLL